eukprot:CAMPEP_0172524178 /NCGR_PEP_ID=MMETSP1066-20121228/294051_1 /TAXON_ID=671091 /ORGANISM="Coscinodiscus wailesii, Strain CCMP2513" /LENGTH=222 /DNA_ID=CAMNT_0013307293 /DNA_START=556 /DNA_END=1224 /DNA_ORIENTATION=-
MNDEESMAIKMTARNELDYVSAVLDEDAKNYHAWSHRQWIITNSSTIDCELWNDEKKYAHSLIVKDCRNNSAWNQRWFASHKGRAKTALSLSDFCCEAEYALEGANVDPHNESPWRYLIGLFKEQNIMLKKAEGETRLIDEYLAKMEGVKLKLAEKDNNPDGCYNLTSAYIDLLQMKGDCNSLIQAADLAHGLSTLHDQIRAKYWIKREGELRSKAAVASTA